LQDGDSAIRRKPHVVKRFFVFFCESLFALAAAEPLQAVSVFSKPLARGLAVVARHQIYLDLSVKASR
jgi:hypothetical protein